MLNVVNEQKKHRLQLFQQLLNRTESDHLFSKSTISSNGSIVYNEGVQVNREKVLNTVREEIFLDYVQKWKYRWD